MTIVEKRLSLIHFHSHMSVLESSDKDKLLKKMAACETRPIKCTSVLKSVDNAKTWQKTKFNNDLSSELILFFISPRGPH